MQQLAKSRNSGWQNTYKDLVSQIKNLKYEIDGMRKHSLRTADNLSPSYSKYL